jgi:hypothetical protein
MRSNSTIATAGGIAVAIALVLPGLVRAGEPTNQPRPVPPTRPEMKQLLEALKDRKPRFSLPELTEAEKEKLGDGKAGYESRLRSLYMPASDSRGGLGFGREADPKMSLTYEFKTQLFWIVSRTNNCQY